MPAAAGAPRKAAAATGSLHSTLQPRSKGILYTAAFLAAGFWTLLAGPFPCPPGPIPPWPAPPRPVFPVPFATFFVIYGLLCLIVTLVDVKPVIVRSEDLSASPPNPASGLGPRAIQQAPCPKPPESSPEDQAPHK